MSTFTLAALVVLSAILAVGGIYTIALQRHLSKSKRSLERAQNTLELNKTSVLLAREILKSAERRTGTSRPMPPFLSPISSWRPNPDPHAVWKNTHFAYEHLPGDMRVSREDREVLEVLRSPGTIQDILLVHPGLGRSLFERVNRLHRNNLLEKIDEKRYVTSHEGHVHGFMTVAEGVVFAHTSKKSSKSIVLARTNGDSQAPGGEIREALDSLCERGYMERRGNSHLMVPLPASPSLSR